MKKTIAPYLALCITNLLVAVIYMLFGLLLFILLRFDTANEPSYSEATKLLMLWYGYNLIFGLLFVYLNIRFFNTTNANEKKNKSTSDRMIVYYSMINFIILLIITVVGIIVVKENNLLQLNLDIPYTKANDYDIFIISFLLLYAFSGVITIAANIIQYISNKKRNQIILYKTRDNIIVSFIPFVLIMGVLLILSFCI